LTITGDDTLYFKIYFDSDGGTDCYINDIQLIVDETADTPAQITGTISLLNPVNLTDDYFVRIETNQGGANVNLSNQVIDITSVSLQEIKTAIDLALVPGLRPAKDDGLGHLVLESITTGEDASVTIKAI
jgi:hypothetical protein